MGAAQDAVAEEGILLARDRMGQTSEAEVREGGMEITPSPPTKTDRGCGAAVRTVGKWVVWRRKKK